MTCPDRNAPVLLIAAFIMPSQRNALCLAACSACGAPFCVVVARQGRPGHIVSRWMHRAPNQVRDWTTIFRDADCNDVTTADVRTIERALIDISHAIMDVTK